MRLVRQPKEVRQKLDVPDVSRVPPGQFVTDKFPVFSYGPTPQLGLKMWRFRIFGMVEETMEFTWEDFMALPQITLSADFHCVTQWSHLDNTWEGVSIQEILKHVRLKPETQSVMAHCYGGYTTNLALEFLASEPAILAHTHNDKPLTPDHGWPLRLVVPQRYGWKSAKWINGLEFLQRDQMGFWEVRGYHIDGNPWREERFEAGPF